MYPTAKQYIYDYSREKPKIKKKETNTNARDCLILVLLIFCVICLTVMGGFLIRQYEDSQNYWLVKYKWTNEKTCIEDNETVYHRIYVYRDGIHMNIDCNKNTWLNINVGDHVKLNENCDKVIDIRSD